LETSSAVGHNFTTVPDSAAVIQEHFDKVFGNTLVRISALPEHDAESRRYYRGIAYFAVEEKNSAFFLKNAELFGFFAFF